MQYLIRLSLNREQFGVIKVLRAAGDPNNTQANEGPEVDFWD